MMAVLSRGNVEPTNGHFLNFNQSGSGKTPDAGGARTRAEKACTASTTWQAMWEWVNDWYRQNYYERATKESSRTETYNEEGHPRGRLAIETLTGSASSPAWTAIRP